MVISKQRKINDCYNHTFKHSDYKEGQFQSDYVVFDVETKERKISETQKHLTFKLISYIFVENFEVVKKGYFWDLNDFWIEFYRFVNSIFKQGRYKIICINNNMGFDLRASKGFYYLQKKLKYKIADNFYLKNRTLILSFERIVKNKRKEITFYDMQNYFPYQRVKDFGQVVGLEKIDIDFDKCTNEELEIYAVRDVEIVWKFLKFYIDFLQDFQLTSKLKPTQSSLALNIYRTRKDFHKGKKIFVHNFIKTFELEKSSYRGGISDVFIKDIVIPNVYYVDINSFYGFIMKYTRLPARLICHLFSCSYSQKDLKKYMQKCFKLEEYCCIANITYSLNEGYVLNEYNEVTCNVYGKYLEGSFCEPELKYIKNHGKILQIHEIAIYETEILFDKYIDFFYDIKKNATGIIREFSKKFLTNLYGKWGQLKEETRRLTESEELEYNEILEDNKDIINNNEIVFCHIATILGEGDLYKINNQLYIQSRKKTKAFDAFVAIASFVTSACRVYLMQLKEIAEGYRETMQVYNHFMQLIEITTKSNKNGVYYTDTDSLFINKKGFENLNRNGFVGSELGQLKNEVGEGKTVRCIFYAPKDYEIADKIKCKGIKKKAKQLSENTFEIEEFESLQKAIKNDNLDKIVITKKVKEMKREYKKGIVGKKGIIKTFRVD